ncbi:hypothetical protein MB901379_01879 [Mycobacterium basiliense]|uniref:Uncharacterized protein n=1 Tax=Mycobacterium basiliense TaxID=2094119 RepID=A0A3S4BDM0_9MYCO|nr:hypothetical protein [Mycobacterium basiliense]VDM88318.1 hypothetical protein MB901379_01879 [Mycobacterium basiliense]
MSQPTGRPRRAAAAVRPGQLLRIAASGALLLLLVACGGSGRTGHAPAHGASSSHGATATSAWTADPLPFNASGLLAGSANPSFPDGEPNTMSVVQIGPLTMHESGSAKLPFAFRNNTSKAVAVADWTGAARSEGSIVATGSSQGTIPARLKSGEVGLAFIYFDDRSPSPPAGAKYEFTVNSTTADEDFSGTAPLKVTEAKASADAIAGSAVNGTGKSAEGPFSVSVYCFDGDQLLSEADAFAEPDDVVAPGGKVTFTVDLFGAKCPTFAVGVSGYLTP